MTNKKQKYQKISSSGSIWRKWDLHLHSLTTYLNNNFNSQDEEKYINALKEKQIEVVGLTNYFKFSDKDFLLKEKLENEGIIVFLNLEVRLDYQNKQDDCLDFHIIFDNNVKKSTIEDFLTNLNVLVGKNSIKAKELKNKKDFNKAVVKYDHLLEVLNSESGKLSTKYLTVFLSRGKGSGRTSTMYDWIAKKTNLLIHSSDNPLNIKEDREFWLKEDPPKPLLQGSDAHSVEEIGTKFTWIKADTTFEGLKQIIYEPEKRISNKERSPSDSKDSRLIIDRVSYEIGKDEKVVYFNKDLNTIIGNRGSGKSTLLKNIAFKTDSEEYELREIKKPYDLKNFKVFWKNDKESKGNDNVFYIPQAYLGSLTYDDGSMSDQLDNFLKKLLKKNESFAISIEKFEKFATQNKLHIQEFIQKLLTADRLLKEETLAAKKLGIKKEIDVQISNKETDIKKYKKGELADKEIQNYTNIKNIFDSNEKKIIVKKSDIEILKKIKNNELKINFFESDFHKLSNEQKENIQKKIQEKNNEILKVIFVKEIKKIQEEIKKLKKENSSNIDKINSFNNKIKDNDSLKELTSELVSLKKVMDKIDDGQSVIQKLKQNRENSIDTLVNAYSEFELEQKKIYKTIKFEENFLFFKMIVVTHHVGDKILTFIDKNIHAIKTNKEIKKEMEDENFWCESPENISKPFLKKIIKWLIEEKIIRKVSIEIDAALTNLLENRFEIDYSNSIKSNSDLTSFKDMTGGQKAITLLEFIFKLEKEKYPVLIDQPEDDLDVEGITKNLVEFIVAEKKDRQIIMVTHNANLVVSTDAENIIFAESKKNKKNDYNFSYKTGSIENLDQRLNIVNILEGGQAALEKRLLKLNLSKFIYPT